MLLSVSPFAWGGNPLDVLLHDVSLVMISLLTELLGSSTNPPCLLTHPACPFHAAQHIIVGKGTLLTPLCMTPHCCAGLTGVPARLWQQQW